MNLLTWIENRPRQTAKANVGYYLYHIFLAASFSLAVIEILLVLVLVSGLEIPEVVLMIVYDLEYVQVF